MEKELKNERVLVLMDKKLRKQLEEYSARNDESNVSLTARRAIKQFIEENK